MLSGSGINQRGRNPSEQFIPIGSEKLMRGRKRFLPGKGGLSHVVTA